jgi:hypothetical protein
LGDDCETKMVEHWRDFGGGRCPGGGGPNWEKVPQAFSDNRTRIVTTLRQTSKIDRCAICRQRSNIDIAQYVPL